jgi:hypothetical protein
MLSALHTWNFRASRPGSVVAAHTRRDHCAAGLQCAILENVGWLKAAVGAAIVLFAVREVFNDLFHPTESGALSEWVASRIFRVFRRWPGMLPTSGPLSIALVILTWAMMLAAGFALIYWASFPAGYDVQSPVPADAWSRWWWSFYFSLEMMTTLGLGDIRPNPTWLKLLSACHTLLGFSLVTASITWILLIFPALRRMRTLARKTMTLREAQEQTGTSVASTGMQILLAGLAEEVIQARVDLIHFPILFYFYTQDPRASLPPALGTLMKFADEGRRSNRDELVRLSATALHIALADLAELVGDRLEMDVRTPEVVFPAFQELHAPQ